MINAHRPDAMREEGPRMDGSASRALQGELREGLLPWALMPCTLVALVAAIFDPSDSPPPSAGSLGMAMLVFVALIYIAHRRRPLLAAWLFIAGLLSAVSLANHWFPAADIDQALIYPVIFAAWALGPREGIITAITATLLRVAGVIGAPSSPAVMASLASGTTVLWGALFLACTTERSQRTMVAWAWQGYAQARKNLEIARDRQVELKQALEDLGLANREVTRLNDLLRAAREAVEEARRAKEEFVANVSHEMRTPLNMIIGFSDEILERPEVYAMRLPASLLKDVASIKRNSEHLAQLVDDVLDLVEADVGFARLNREWTSMRDVILQAAEAVAGFFEKKQLQLNVDIPDALPPVHCDHHRVRQVLLNLLSNAARFTYEGGVRVEASVGDGSMVLRVADTGPGIDPAMAQRLFEPFQQADPSTRRRYGGTGLGLAISRRFVEMHGGRIWIESTVGVGTTVSFSLPLQIEETRPAARRWVNPYQEYEPRTRPSMAPQSAPMPRLVVVEEGQALSDLVRHYLDGLEVATCRGVAEAREAIDKKPAVALLINKMPTENLFGLLSELAPMSFDVPIMSCWVPERDVVIAQMGVQGYLIKPIRRADLLDGIARAAPAARRILLVEDDVEARQLFERMLASDPAGYRIAYAGDGETALEYMRSWNPDLVLLDLVMPGHDGFGVLAARQEDPALLGIPVIIISAKDPRREPIMSNALMLTRPLGLSGRDLMFAAGAIVDALPPRFGAPVRRGTPAPS